MAWVAFWSAAPTDRIPMEWDGRGPEDSRMLGWLWPLTRAIEPRKETDMLQMHLSFSEVQDAPWGV